MARGNKKKPAVHRHRTTVKSETPVTDRLRAIVASRNASPEATDTDPATPPRESVVDVIGNWITGQSSGGSLKHGRVSPVDSMDVVVTPPSPTPLSKNARRRKKRKSNQSTEIEPSTPILDSVSFRLDSTGPSSWQSSASRTTSYQSMDGSVDPFPVKPLELDSGTKGLLGAEEERDSIGSHESTYRKPGEIPQVTEGQGRPNKAWFQNIRPHSWRPCPLYRWLRDLVVTFYTGLSGPRKLDFFLSIVLFLTCVYVAYAALDFMLLGLIKPVKAQDIVEAANCSVVYVTIPGPIITVSLIAATPSDPARGTYYYSVINGTTEYCDVDSVVRSNRSAASWYLSTCFVEFRGIHPDYPSFGYSNLDTNEHVDGIADAVTVYLIKSIRFFGSFFRKPNSFIRAIIAAIHIFHCPIKYTEWKSGATNYVYWPENTWPSHVFVTSFRLGYIFCSNWLVGVQHNCSDHEQHGRWPDHSTD
ncbi:hypothetical protein N0V94_003602 [Neodidymelliopsis sp. IMI 364377]|nr:hypothetical protein N0V94_003602 [Neodidymelliopsis sp. IMI 364377]